MRRRLHHQQGLSRFAASRLQVMVSDCKESSQVLYIAGGVASDGYAVRQG